MATVTGIDLGTQTVRILQGRMKGETFTPTRYLTRAVAEGETPVEALAALLRETKLKARLARFGLTGRDMILRYSQAPRLTDAQLRNLMRFEIDELAQQAGGNLASDFNLLPIPPGVSGDDTVLVGLARNEALEATTQAVAGTGCTVGSFTPNAVALYDAFLKLGSVGDDGVLIANVGNENSDVAIVLGPDLAFARNVSGGGGLFTTALRERFGADAERAEEMKRTLVNLSPTARGHYRSPQEEKASQSLLGPAGQFGSLLQSTATLAKAQLKLPELRIARALLCGGGARLLGLGEFLSASTGWEVTLFDPLRGLDLAALPPDERDALEAERHEAVVAIGLALASGDRALYRLDILPEAILKRRRFVERTSFVIAAGVLAAAFLGVDAVVRKSLADDARDTAATARQEAKKVIETNDRTLRLVGTDDSPGRNRTLADEAAELELRAACGLSLVDVERAIRSQLHPDLWVTRMTLEVEKSNMPDLRTGDLRRPIVKILGRGREGAERIDQSFRASTTKLQEMFPGVGFVQAPHPSSRGFEWEIRMDLVPAVAPDAPPAPGN